MTPNVIFVAIMSVLILVLVVLNVLVYGARGRGERLPFKRQGFTHDPPAVKPIFVYGYFVQGVRKTSVGLVELRLSDGQLVCLDEVAVRKALLPFGPKEVPHA